MDPGKRNKRVRILRFNENETDGAGGFHDDWKEEKGWDLVVETWAKITPLRGRHFYEAERGQSELTHEANIRYVKGITPSMIMVYDHRRFDIQHVINRDERNKELELTLIERVIE